VLSGGRFASIFFEELDGDERDIAELTRFVKATARMVRLRSRRVRNREASLVGLERRAEPVLQTRTRGKRKTRRD